MSQNEETFYVASSAGPLVVLQETRWPRRRVQLHNIGASDFSCVSCKMASTYPGILETSGRSVWKVSSKASRIWRADHLLQGRLLRHEVQCPWRKQQSDLGRLQNHAVHLLWRDAVLGETEMFLDQGTVLHRESHSWKANVRRLCHQGEESTALGLLSARVLDEEIHVFRGVWEVQFKLPLGASARGLCGTRVVRTLELGHDSLCRDGFRREGGVPCATRVRKTSDTYAFVASDRLSSISDVTGTKRRQAEQQQEITRSLWSRWSHVTWAKLQRNT